MCNFFVLNLMSIFFLLIVESCDAVEILCCELIQSKCNVDGKNKQAFPWD